MDNVGKEVTVSSSLLGNRVVGILAESANIWERRAPLTPSHCARLLLGGKGGSGIDRIIVQPSTKRIHHDARYEDVGCVISNDLSECGLILGIKQPKLEAILPDRAYAFFSHTHKAQKENMPLLDKVLADRVSLYDYELIVGDDGKRMLAFGKFAGRAGFIDFLHGLGQRYLSLGFSTPFLSLGASYMYPSLAAAKAAIISVSEEIATLGLPLEISPVVFVFTGNGNVSQGAQEIFKLLPHTFIEVEKLPELFKDRAFSLHNKTTKREFQVYGCIVTSEDMVSPKDPMRNFSKDDYYAHPEHYNPVFHEKIAPYASAIVNCMYWERRFPRLLTTNQIEELMKCGCPLVGVCDITCDVGGSIEFINRATTVERPFFRYDPFRDTYHDDMFGDGVICLAVDILPTEFPREASQHFGDILLEFVGSLASAKELSGLPPHLRKACIAHAGVLTALYEYIPRMRNSSLDLLPNPTSTPSGKKFTTLVSLSGHLFDQFLINEALDIIEVGGGSFRLVRCELGQSTNDVSYSKLEVGADDIASLDRIIDSLTSLANSQHKNCALGKERELSLKIGKIDANETVDDVSHNSPAILILGAGRVCQPAAEFLVSSRRYALNSEHVDHVKVIVASLYLKDAEETIKGLQNAQAIELDVMDVEKLSYYVAQVEVVISLLPASFHPNVATVCIQHRKHMVTASYVDDSMSKLDEAAKAVGVSILCEMGLDPGIDHMLSMKVIDQAHMRNGKVKKFASYCGGLPAPAAANNPLAYKFSWNPAGAIRAGRNPADYKLSGELVHIDGDKLYDSAGKLRLLELPALALEYLPNRNSLVYGNLYGISDEASTIFRATLRYEGFSKIMSSLGKMGYFNIQQHPLLLQTDRRPTFNELLDELLSANGSAVKASPVLPAGRGLGDELAWRVMMLGHSKDEDVAINTAKTIKFLGLHEDAEIPSGCATPFDVVCLRMEQRLSYKDDEQDMVLLHHELEIEFPNGKRGERHQLTLWEFGKTHNGKNTTAMALTVGIPAAIGALLLLQRKVQKKGILRPLESEIYVPALELLETAGIKIQDKTELL